MYYLTQFKEALLNLKSTKLRSFLAILGILVGTGSVVAMISSGQLATEQALSQFKKLGTDLLSVSLYQQGDKSSTSLSAKLTIKDIQRIPIVITAVKEISGYTMVYVPIIYRGASLDAVIIGADSHLQEVIKLEMKQGRALSFLDQYSYFCVIGEGVARTLQASGVKDPIGQQIQLGSNYFTIIGVAKQWQENTFFNQNINDAILVPLPLSLVLSKDAEITNVVMRLAPNVDIDGTQDAIKEYIQQIVPAQQYYFRSAKALLNSMSHQQKILTLMLGMIGSISLFVGGIGVMNIMLVSVVERKREIGIRKAVGATRRDIQWLFLLEAVLLSLLGGSFGVILGIAASWIIAYFTGWQFTLFIIPPLIGFLVSVIVGIFFGFYPAYQAAKLDPIQTLRSD
jgi:putative ABC transport system permease protein